MSEGKSRPHTAAPGEGESVWLVGDSITLRLTSEDTGGAFSLFEGTIPPGGVGRRPTYSTARTGPSTCWTGGSSSWSAKTPSRGRGLARASTRPVSPCTRSRT